MKIPRTTSTLAILILIAASLSNTSTAQTIRYVKAGASWSNPGDLQSMIDASNAGDQVWAAGGTYQPASNQSYTMKAGVAIYGNFDGTETSLSQRDLTLTANTSTLKGNGTTVVRNVYNNLSSTALLDGFTITGGSDGGIYNVASSPSFNNCIITANTGSSMGGLVTTAPHRYLPIARLPVINIRPAQAYTIRTIQILRS